MIGILSVGIAKWLLRTGAISQEDEELYEYAAYSLLFSLIPLVLVIVIGGLLRMMIEGIFLILPFMLIRKFCGGFHFQSPGICFFSSIILLIFFLMGIRYTIFARASAIFTPAVFLATIQIYIVSPIDSKVRNLSVREHNAFCKITRILLFLVFSVYILLLWLGIQRIAASIGGSIVMTAFLQIPCFFIRNIEANSN